MNKKSTGGCFFYKYRLKCYRCVGFKRVIDYFGSVITDNFSTPTRPIIASVKQVLAVSNGIETLLNKLATVLQSNLKIDQLSFV